MPIKWRGKVMGDGLEVAQIAHAVELVAEVIKTAGWCVFWGLVLNGFLSRLKKRE